MTTADDVIATTAYRRFATATSLTKAIADALVLALVVAGAGLAFGLALGPIFPPLRDSIGRLMDGLPQGLTALIGSVDMSTAAGWYGGELYSIVAPLAIVTLGAWSAARAFAGEIEARSIGLLVAAPVSRTRIAADKAAAMVAHVGIGTAGMLVGTWAGATLAGLDLRLGAIVAMSLHLALLGATFGALALVIAVITGRRVISVLIAVGIALISYAWAAFAPLTDRLDALTGLSPWHHYNGSDPLTRGLEPASAIVLAVLTGTFLAAGVALFGRRELPG